MNKNDEMVMGVSTSALFQGGHYFTGFRPWGPQTTPILDNILNQAEFRSRGACENDPSFKQIIPYCIVSSGNKIFVYRRENGGGESRLFSKGSIGIGGHINPYPKMLNTSLILTRSIYRELREELNFSLPLVDFHLIPEGMLNIDVGSVNKVHFALVYKVVFPPQTEITVREKDTLKGSLMSVREVLAAELEWETWSKIILDNFYG